MDPRRQLVFHFLSLAHTERVAIAVELELAREEDDGVRDVELVKRYLQRAMEENRLRDLWVAVEQRHPDGQADPNPFV